MMHTYIVTHYVNRGYQRSYLLVQVFQETDELYLSFALVALTVDSTGPSVEGGK